MKFAMAVHKQEVTVTLAFDFRQPKSNHFIFESKWIFLSKLKKILENDPEMLRSQDQRRVLKGRSDLELWTPKSYQFIT